MVRFFARTGDGGSVTTRDTTRRDVTCAMINANGPRSTRCRRPRGRHVLSESILAPDKSWTLILLSCSVKFPPGNSSPRREKRRGGGANSRETSCLIKLRLTRRGQLGYGRGYHELTTAGISNRLQPRALRISCESRDSLSTRSRVFLFLEKFLR